MKKGIIALVALALLVPLAAIAQEGPDPEAVGSQGHGMMGPGMGRMGHGPMGPGQCCMGGDREGRGGDRPGIERLMMLADKIGLTEQQRDQLKKMQVDFRMQMIDREADLKKAEVQLQSLMMDKNAPEAEVDRAIDDVARFRADVQKLKYSHHKQVRGVLTDEQFEKLQKMREERRGEMPDMGQGMGNWMRVPGPGKHSMGGRP